MLTDLLSRTVSLLKCNRVLYLPFVIFFAVEFFCLIIIYLSNYQPLSFVFGPIVKAFWGEQFLHFPFNFILLPKFASLSRLVLSVVIGSVLSGAATLIAANLYHKKNMQFPEAILKTLKKYISLFVILFILNAALYFFFKLIGLVLFKFFSHGSKELFFIPVHFWSYGLIPIMINFIVAVFFQAVFIFSVPLVMLDNLKPLTAMARSVMLFFKLFRTTSLLVTLLMLIYLPILILNMKTAALIENVFPEFIIIIAIMGSVLSSLILDPLITVASTLLFIKNKEASPVIK